MSALFGMGKNENYDPSYKYMTAACTGVVIPISELGDTIYSTGVLGDGYAVTTESDKVFSPVSGIIEKISNNGHSYNIISDDGMKVLVHVGKDSKCDSMQPSTPHIVEKETIAQGQLLCVIGCKQPDEDNKCTVEVVVSNSDKFDTFELLPQKVLDVKSSVLRYK